MNKDSNTIKGISDLGHKTLDQLIAEIKKAIETDAGFRELLRQLFKKS